MAHDDWAAIGTSFEFRADPAPPDSDYCPFAEQFEAWTRDLLTQTLTEPTHVKLAQAKVQLLDKYFEWRINVPKLHRNRIGDSSHTCIFHVFEESYHALKTVELSLTPPQLYLPEPEKKPRKPRRVKEPEPPTYAGTLLGEIE